VGCVAKSYWCGAQLFMYSDMHRVLFNAGTVLCWRHRQLLKLFRF